MLCLHVIKSLMRCVGALALMLPMVSAATEQPPLRLYSTQNAYPNPNNAFIEKTRGEIERVVGRRVVHYPVTIEELDGIVARGEADILIVGAGFYRRHVRDGLRDVATVVSDRQPDPNHAVGATVVTRSDRDDIHELADLRAKVLAANAPLGFQGILTTLVEIAKLGEDPEHFFKGIRYVGMDLRPAIDAVKSGKVDAAILTSCLMETSQSNGHDFMEGLKVVGVKVQNFIRCQVSTDLYPNWSLLITPRLDTDTVQKVVLAAHSMPRDEHGIGWAMASDFSSVDAMLQTLKIGPYEYLRHWTFQRVWKEYGHWVVLLVLFILGLVGHSIAVTKIVQNRTRALQDALQKQRELTEKIVRLRNHYESLVRISMISQISSVIAHELSQPLGGILLYTGGLKTLLQKLRSQTDVDLSEVETTVAKIEKRADKANAIVATVRNYAKSQKDQRQRIDMGVLLDTVCHDAQTVESVDTAVIRVDKPQTPVYVDGVRFDLEIAILNLIRNAWQACRTQPQPQIWIALTTNAGKVNVRVEDNAPAVREETLLTLTAPLSSSKSEGLGLGLAIVRSIMEKHLGQLSITRSSHGGIAATLTFPVAQDEEQR